MRRTTNRFSKSGKALLVIGLVVVVLVLVFVRVATGAGDSIDYINAERTQPLQRDAALASHAQTHAETMAEAGDVFHSSLPVGDAEIVGRGGSIGSIHEAFMASPSHRATLLSDFARAGAGSAVRDGVVYVAVVFGGSAAPPTTAPAPTTTTTKNTTTTERQEDEQQEQESKRDRVRRQEVQEGAGENRSASGAGTSRSHECFEYAPDA